jgi:hypothetical protein
MSSKQSLKRGFAVLRAPSSATHVIVVPTTPISGIESSACEALISLTDPDSRAMAVHTNGVGYNIQVAVDAKHKMIVEQAMGGPNSHIVHMFRSDAGSR